MIATRLIPLTLLLSAFCASPTFAANTIVLGINGDAQVGANSISFASDYPLDTTFAPAPDYGNFQVSQVSPGSILALAGVTTAEMGLIQSLNTTLEPVKTSPDFTNTYNNLPFMTFTGGGSSQQLFLTAILQGSLTAGSPFGFTSTPTGLVADFGMDGYILNTLDGSKAPYTGTFSITFNGIISISDLTSALPVQTPFSATFSVNPVPEPGSILLMALGLMGAGITARRKISATTAK